MSLLDKTTFKGGLELKFFEQGEFEALDDVDSSQHGPILARNILRFFTMGWTKSWTQFLTPSVLYSFFLQRNTHLLKDVRLAMQQGFLELFKQLQDKDLNAEQREQVQLYLSNCLSMLPYGDLTPYESFKIPQCIDGHWELIEYQVTPIELTERPWWQRFFTYDYDRVFAYGLKPIVHKKAESHLIFMGTTYPAGQGFFTQIKTDSKGFESIGLSLYRSGRERIQTWLSQQKNSIHVCGVSLGGSLSLLLSLDKGNYKKPEKTGQTEEQKLGNELNTLEKAEALFKAKDYSGARGVFQEFMKAFPKSKYSHYARLKIGETYYYEEDYGKALPEYKKVIANYPDSNT